MEEYTNRELGLKIENLQKEIRNGFKGVHERQDKTNGKVLRNCDEIEKINGWKNKMIGAMVIMNILLVPVIISLTILMIKSIF